MNTTHAKSPCCRARINKFGERRRQCNLCQKTWRIRRKRRGRKRIRVTTIRIENYLFGNSLPTAKLAQRINKNRELVRRRLKSGLVKYLAKRSWEMPPPGNLILIADAMWQGLEGVCCTIYLCLVRPIDSDRAYILKPVIISDGESYEGWKTVLSALPDELRSRIVALVCDGHTGLLILGRNYGWHIQRCHFHVLARIYKYASPGKLRRQGNFALFTLGAVRGALKCSSDDLEYFLDDIKFASKIARNILLRRVLSGLHGHIEDYRTYLRYPEYNLPITSNAAESLIGLIRGLLFRARGFRTIDSFTQWLEAFCLHKKYVKCRGKFQPN